MFKISLRLALLSCLVALLVPAWQTSARADGTTSQWVVRDEGAPGRPQVVHTWTPPASSDPNDPGQLFVGGSGSVLGVSTGGLGPYTLQLDFTAPLGQTVQEGATYRVHASPYASTSAEGRLWVLDHGTMCGRSMSTLWRYVDADNWMLGTIHIDELDHDQAGQVTGVALTFTLNCQILGGQPGLEGSVAVHANRAPSALPDVPAAPGPITDVTTANHAGGTGDSNVQSVAWRNPTSNWGDTVVDRLTLGDDPSNLTPYVDNSLFRMYRGRGSAATVPYLVDWYDTATFRLVPRGPDGRLGSPVYATVKGTRFDSDDGERHLTVGQSFSFAGRITEAFDNRTPADWNKGPAVPGRTMYLQRAEPTTGPLDWTTIGTTTTDADGRFSVTLTPNSNTYYRLVLPPTPTMLGNATSVVTQVYPQTDLEVSQGVVSANARMHFSTSGARAGSRGIVRLQELVGHRWRTVLTRRLAGGGATRTGRVHLTYRTGRRGGHLFRLVKPGDAHHVNGISRTVHVTVR